MKTIKELEKEIQTCLEFMSNPEPNTMEEALEGDLEEFENDFKGLQLKAQLIQTKAICEMIEEEDKNIHNIMVKEFRDEILSKIKGEVK